MDIIQVCRDVQTNGYAIVRVTPDQQREKGQPYQYDLKRTGKKKGWFYFDAYTASAVLAVYDAVNDANKAKIPTLALPTLLNIVWQNVK